MWRPDGTGPTAWLDMPISVTVERTTCVTCPHRASSTGRSWYVSCHDHGRFLPRGVNLGRRVSRTAARGPTVRCVSGPGRPTVDVVAQLHPAEWRELFREDLRLSGFWSRTGAAAAVVPVAGASAVVLGVPVRLAATITLVAVVAVGAFAAALIALGPHLRWSRLSPEALAVRWQVGEDRILTHRAGDRLDLVWTDVDQVVVTRLLVVLHLGERREVLGLPRRAATPLGESLITGWAEDSGADVVRRGRATAPATNPSRAG